MQALLLLLLAAEMVRLKLAPETAEADETVIPNAISSSDGVTEAGTKAEVSDEPKRRPRPFCSIHTCDKSKNSIGTNPENLFSTLNMEEAGNNFIHILQGVVKNSGSMKAHNIRIILVGEPRDGFITQPIQISGVLYPLNWLYVNQVLNSALKPFLRSLMTKKYNTKVYNLSPYNDLDANLQRTESELLDTLEDNGNPTNQIHGIILAYTDSSGKPYYTFKNFLRNTLTGKAYNVEEYEGLPDESKFRHNL